MNQNLREEVEAIHHHAMEIIESEWRATSVTEEALELDERLAEVLARDIATGADVTQLLRRWERMTPAEILAEADRRDQPETAIR